MSPLRIERAARAEHLWQRTATYTVPVADPSTTFFDVLFPAFTSAGGACLKSVSMTITVAGDPPVVTAVPVTIVGIAGVWDFTDSSPDWTERVAIPCEVETLEISVTTARCACNVVCEGCLYPAGVGGLFMVRYRFTPIAIPAGAVIVFTASGSHTPSAPCCTMPQFLSELPVNTDQFPVQAYG